jgi:hypothetical protein
LVFISCKKEVNSVGNSIVNSESPFVGAVDTFALSTKTILEDSVYSDHPSFLLLGSLVDSYSGKVNAGFCSQLRLISTSPNFGEESAIAIDSVVLSMRYIDAYGINAPVKFEVFRLTENIEDKSYFAYSDLKDDGIDLNTNKQFITPRMNGTYFVNSSGDTVYDQISIQLNKDLGKELISEAQNNTTTYSSIENFNNWFKGLKIKASNDQLSSGEGAIYYIATAPRLTIYYKLNQENKKYYFELNQNANRFNQLNFDNNGFEVDKSLQTADYSSFFCQANQYRSFIKLPSISNLSSNSVVHSAVLTIPYDVEEVKKYYPGNSISVSIPNSLYDKRLRFIASGFIDTLNKVFVVDLRDHIQNVITGKRLNLGLYISPTEFSTSATRIKFLNKEGSKPKLYIKVSSFKQ